MNHLYPHFANQMRENDLPLDCGCSTLFNQEDPFFLVRCEHSLTHEDHHHHPHPESKNNLHQSTTDSHYSYNKMSLKRQKDKTSMKHLEHQKSTPFFLTHKQSEQKISQKSVKGKQSNEERRNPEFNSIRNSLEFPLPTLPENLLQRHSFQHVQADNKGQLKTPTTSSKLLVMDTHHLDVHPKINFRFESPKEPLSRCQSEKLFNMNSSCVSQKSKENPQSSRKYPHNQDQENVEVEDHLDFHKKKQIKTKMSYDTNCSQSSNKKENLHFVREQILNLMGSHIKNGKKSLKGPEKSHRGIKNMSDLYEVKSVLDQSQQESDGESIVLDRLLQSDGLGLFAQFQEPEEDDFRAKRRFTLKQF